MSDYESPLISRYASKDMSEIFSEEEKIVLWRRLWVALAETEKELGLDISDRQIEEMKANVNNLNLDVAHEREKIVRHDVMAQVYAYAQQCPLAAPVIHLGATSCFVDDNADLITYYKALYLVKNKLVAVIAKLKDFALKYKDLPTLAFTHFQPAQPTTVGKRATLWMQDLVFDFENVERFLNDFRLRGVKGTTGTEASFKELFNGDYEKVKKLDAEVCRKMGFSGRFLVSGQTYTRKYDFEMLSILSGIAQSAMKFANDIRLLQSMKEVEEPFEKTQIGSSAMAYKRNPMRSERICSLARYVTTLPENAAMTAGTQWFERTLDDSANRRIVIPEAFLAVDGILDLYNNVAENLVVYEKMIKHHLDAEIPFMATENILMECVKAGGNRQELHEKIRVHSMEAGKKVKVDGEANDLLDRIRADESFAAIHDKIDEIVNVQNFIGFAPQQVEDFVKEAVDPVLARNPAALNIKADIRV
ncbi:MAG: adenylosuccinate lyase [Eubacteriales bacterium]|nr:adenylosuccinate lyase [Christensenellaceae bacterium]MDY3241450.1 adenylosuccinate lyase [Eubacteriales bacterium]